LSTSGETRFEKSILQNPPGATPDVPIGSVTSDIAATADEIEFPNFKAAFFGGEAKGRARMRLDGRGQSELVTDLSGLDIDRAIDALRRITRRSALPVHRRSRRIGAACPNIWPKSFFVWA